MFTLAQRYEAEGLGVPRIRRRVLANSREAARAPYVRPVQGPQPKGFRKKPKAVK